MRIFKLILIGIIIFIIAGCSNETENEAVSKEGEKYEEITGYILNIEEKRFLMIDTDDESVYKDLEGLTMEEMLQGDPDIPLVYVNYPDVSGLDKGDQILVEYDGVMTFSIPGQINASNVNQIEKNYKIKRV